MAKNDMHAHRMVAQNRKARHTYFIEDNVEAGIMLAGTEVKTLRDGKGNISESYAGEDNAELWLFNAYIPTYDAGSYNNHEPRRPRKILMHRREIDRLTAAIKEKGVTLVPLSIYFNDRGIAKVDIGLARGKKQHDKRETEKKRDWERQKARILRDRN
jgi:SsrA-binding protein